MSAADAVPCSALEGVGTPLQFADVRRLVETASPLVELRVDNGDAETDGKGRYLVARRNISAGEIVLSEPPLFHGTTGGTSSSKAYTKEFAAQASDADIDGSDLLEDRLHPASPLMDCVGQIILTKRKALHGEDKTARATAKLRIRELWALCRNSGSRGFDASGVSSEHGSGMEAEMAKEIFGVLRSDLQDETSVEELHAILRTISCNRFGGEDAGADSSPAVIVMFAGSMFEHSCVANVFLASWSRKKPTDWKQNYRALRDIQEGEALSINYLQVADDYLSATDRGEILGRWGFSCRCARCTSLPDLSRAFVCPTCAAPELCPALPLASDGNKLVCRSCGLSAGVEASARLLAHEAALRKRCGGSPWFGGGSDDSEDEDEDQVVLGIEGDGLIGRHHYAVFGVNWALAQEDPETCGVGVDEYVAAVEAVIQSLSRLHGGNAKQPQLLQLYHLLAKLSGDDLGRQQYYLRMEDGVIERNYPEEFARQDEEVTFLLHGPGGKMDVFAEDDGKMDGFAEDDMSAMD